MDPASHDSSQRMDELEIRLSFQDELLCQLDEVVREQADQLETLRAELKTLRAELREQPAGQAFKLEEEIPPHY